MRTLTDGLASPWGLAALPGGDLLVASRDEATITRIDGESGGKTELGSVPGVAPAGEGGLLGLALSPDVRRGPPGLRVLHHRVRQPHRTACSTTRRSPPGEQLGAPDTILRGIPKGPIHNGGRIAFGPDRCCTRARARPATRVWPRTRPRSAGKILRMTPDGEPVHGNPEADSVVYSYGHRNVQGLAWDGRKRLWAVGVRPEHLGRAQPDRAGQELRLAGGGGQGRASPGFVDPVAQWKTSEASPSGIAYAEGSIWMAGLRGERLWRIPLSGKADEAAGGRPRRSSKGSTGGCAPCSRRAATSCGWSRATRTGAARRSRATTGSCS